MLPPFPYDATYGGELEMERSLKARPKKRKKAKNVHFSVHYYSRFILNLKNFLSAAGSCEMAIGAGVLRLSAITCGLGSGSRVKHSFIYCDEVWLCDGKVTRQRFRHKRISIRSG